MAQLVVSNAMLACTFGSAPSNLTVLPACMVNAPAPTATIMDYVPLVNIMTFKMCSAPTNPAVVAALGAPVPCVPVTTDPWIPGSPTVTIAKKIALNDSSTCLCKFLGVISVTAPGQAKTTIP